MNGPWQRREVIGKATLYLGDCREVLPTIGKVDAVVTDPPYGIGERTARKSAGRGRGGEARLGKGCTAQARDWPAVINDDQPFDPAVLLAFPKAVIFGGNHFASRLPDASKWIIWDKRENTGPDDNADCELAWTNLKGPARIHRQLWRGCIWRGEENRGGASARLHPTQKPIALMDFCLSECRLIPNSTVFDPFMGSGPTGIAAVRRGFDFVGVEIDPTYFDIACRRIEDAQRQGSLFGEQAA